MYKYLIYHISFFLISTWSFTFALSNSFQHYQVIAFVSNTYQNLNSTYNLLHQYGSIHLLSHDRLRVNQLNWIALSKTQLYHLKRHQDWATIKTIKHQNLHTLIQQSPKQKDDYQYLLNNSLITTTSVKQQQQQQQQQQNRKPELHFYQSYHVWSDFLIKWKRIAKQYSSNVKLIVIGKTWQNRPIHAFVIGPKEKSQIKSKILLNGLQHAREWISAVVPTYISEELAIASQGESQHNNLSQYMKHTQVIIVPMINPDGYVYTHTTNRKWRKNKRPNTGCTDQDSDGVDLNRNWEIDFAGTSSTSKDPCQDIYIGPHAFSEPETKAVRDLVLTYGPFNAHLDFHSYGQLVLGPWSYTDDPPPRLLEVDAVGAHLKYSMISGDGSMYKYSRGANQSLMYPASGIMSDWMFSKGSMSFTIELRPTEDQFYSFSLPEEQILPTCQEGLMATKSLLRYGLEPKAIVQEFKQGAKTESNVPNQKSSSSKKRKSSKSSDVPFIAGISVGVVVLLGVIIMIVIVVRRSRKVSASPQQSDEDPKSDIDQTSRKCWCF